MPDREFSEIVKTVLDSVVKINTPDGGTGSGLILEGRLILTCEHVIGGAKALQITLRDGRRINADVLAADSTVDLAILRPKLQTDAEVVNFPKGMELTHMDLVSGQELVAIGHPLGLEWSVTGGHYNATREENEASLSQIGINLKTRLIQVDVVINPGNSGGPVIDREGRVVGIATGIVNPAVANNIGFVIPVESAMRFRDALGDETSTSPVLIPYNCGHHHPPGLEFCPVLGKAIKPVGSAPKETAVGETRYSCGHFHSPDLKFCPLSGKPIVPVAGPVAGREDKARSRKVRYSCGHEHPAGLSYCPLGGKPIKPVQPRR